MAGRFYDSDKNPNGDQHIYGVPLADITEEQYEGYPRWVQEQIDASPLYRKTAPKAAAKPKAAPAPAPSKEQPEARSQDADKASVADDEQPQQDKE